MLTDENELLAGEYLLRWWINIIADKIEFHFCQKLQYDAKSIESQKLKKRTEKRN
jgi:hypothetical protein